MVSSVLCASEGVRVFGGGVGGTKARLTPSVRHLRSKSDLESIFQAALCDLSLVESARKDFSTAVRAYKQVHGAGCPTLSPPPTRHTLVVPETGLDRSFKPNCFFNERRGNSMGVHKLRRLLNIK